MRALNKREARYSAIELEELGLVFAVQKFRPYIDGAKTTVITDHSPLKALLHRRDLTGRLAKYEIALQEFDITITYRPGNRNIVCDTLSRFPPSTEVIATITGSMSLNMASVRAEQDNCPWIVDYKHLLADDPLSLPEYITLNDVLYRIPTKLTQDPIVVLPDDSGVQHDLITRVHTSQMGAAHLGIKKTQSIIAKIAV